MQRVNTEAPVIDLHRQMVFRLLFFLAKEGFYGIESAHQADLFAPQAIAGADGTCYVPDVTAWRQEQEHLFAITTPDHLAQDHTRRQLTAFYHYACQNGARLCLYIRGESRQQACRLMEELQIPASAYTLLT
ncbi:MAG: hypothetical protein IH614_14840 [Desulfuromonadales bacterium]|nr:hypothetical protein [Desulfuromonadales bacterium]